MVTEVLFRLFRRQFHQFAEVSGGGPGRGRRKDVVEVGEREGIGEGHASVDASLYAQTQS